MTIGNPADGPLPALQITSAASRRPWRAADNVTAPRPQTHHEILRLIEPFSRRGRHVDLTASNRIERHLVFRPIVHAGGMLACAGMREILELENPRVSAGLF